MKLLILTVCLTGLLGLTVGQLCGVHPALFQCANGKCVLAQYTCDGADDCGDGSDEPPIINPDKCRACRSNEWRCNNGKCILDSYICDYDNDCQDGSDERQDCPACPDDRFACEIGGCIRGNLACNRNNDCFDWSDEKEENCPCADNEARCASPTPPGEPGLPGNCIPAEFWCDDDDIWDCLDGSDQVNCTSTGAHGKGIPRRRHGGVKLANLVNSVASDVEKRRLKSKFLTKKY